MTDLPVSNIFRPRIDWNIISMTAKKYTHNYFAIRVARIIEMCNLPNPLTKTKIQKRQSALSRQIFMSIMVKHADMSQVCIADLIDKNHSTVNYSIGQANDLYDTDTRFRQMYDEIETKVKQIL